MNLEDEGLPRWDQRRWKFLVNRQKGGCLEEFWRNGLGGFHHRIEPRHRFGFGARPEKLLHFRDKFLRQFEDAPVEEGVECSRIADARLDGGNLDQRCIFRPVARIGDLDRYRSAPACTENLGAVNSVLKGGRENGITVLHERDGIGEGGRLPLIAGFNMVDPGCAREGVEGKDCPVVGINFDGFRFNGLRPFEPEGCCGGKSTSFDEELCLPRDGKRFGTAPAYFQAHFPDLNLHGTVSQVRAFWNNKQPGILGINTA